MEMPAAVYVALVKEEGQEPFILGTGYADLASAQMMIKHRAEEFIDEQVTIAAETGQEVGDLTLLIADDNNTIRVLGASDPGLMGRTPILMQITLQAATINDIVVPVREQNNG